MTASMANCDVSYTEVKDAAVNVEHCLVPTYGFDSSWDPVASTVLTAESANCAFVRGSVCSLPKATYYYVDFIKPCTGCKEC
jgi:hypothetical protein